jgi:hypothetical protein
MLKPNHLRYVPILFRDHSALHMVGGHNGNFYQKSHRSIVCGTKGRKARRGALFVGWAGVSTGFFLEDETIADLQLFGFFCLILARKIVRLMRIISGDYGRLV